MPDEIQLASLEPHLTQHEADLADLRQQADAVAAQLADPGSVKGDRRARRGTARAKVSAPEKGGAPAKEAPSREVLQADRERLERSIATHELLIGLGRDERVGAVLAEVAADRELAREAAADPRGFAAERGIEVPENVVFDMQVDDNTTFLRISHLDDDMPFVLVWTPDGFNPPTEAALPEVPDAESAERA